MEVQYHDLIKIWVLFPAIPSNLIVGSPTHIQSTLLLALSYLLQPIGHIHCIIKIWWYEVDNSLTPENHLCQVSFESCSPLSSLDHLKWGEGGLFISIF